jgi:hypothetical protein
LGCQIGLPHLEGSGAAAVGDAKNIYPQKTQKALNWGVQGGMFCTNGIMVALSEADETPAGNGLTTYPGVLPIRLANEPRPK